MTVNQLIFFVSVWHVCVWHVKLLQSFLTKFVPHGLAIVGALGERHSCVQHLRLDCVDLSAVDGVVFAKEVSKMRYWANLPLHLKTV